MARVQAIDLTGQKFHSWTVHGKVSRNSHNVQWLCRCDCGHEKIISGSNLRKGSNKSCPRCNLALIKKRYNHWTVIGFAYNKNKTNYYHIQCDCGYKTIKQSSKIGQSKWCRKCEGKIVREKLNKPHGANTLNSCLGSYKNAARSRNYAWDITDQEAINLMKGKCNYCGREPFRFARASRANGGLYVNGIDRIDNTKGYIRGNVCSCCEDCNKAKSVLSEREFLSLIKMIYKNRIQERRELNIVQDQPGLLFPEQSFPELNVSKRGGLA